MIPKIHARAISIGMVAKGDIWALCGVPNVPHVRLSTDDDQVTCVRCLTIIGQTPVETDGLREIVEVASARPWKVHSVPANTARLHGDDDRYIANFAPTGSWKARKANARLAVLGANHLLALRDRCQNLIDSARLVPDVFTGMEGTTDCYAVTLGDFDELCAVLAALDADAKVLRD